MLKIQQLIATFGDSHTYLGWYPTLKPELYLPIGVYPFSDGVFILSASKEYSTLIGKRLTKINGHPIEKVIDSLNTLITDENIALKKDFFPKFIASTQVLDFFKFGASGSYSLEVEDENNNVTTHPILSSIVGKQFVSVPINNLPYSWLQKKTAFTKKYFKEDKILHVVYNSCVPISIIRNNGKDDSLKFEDFQEQIFNDLKESDVDKLLFDMRFNGGGNSIYGTGFVNELSRKNINQTGKLFVVIGRSTFSSAILNTLDFKKKTNAIIIGEETGGKPNHYGEVRTFKLPGSKLSVQYSTKYFKNSESEINTIVPDVKIEITFKDFINGKDPIYEWVKNHSGG
ncbi:MAG: peptidase S41 [Bacteroidetes bacterium OLB12]|nr:MAG: peptidase S41 [Bacteroidetes bacterium OLB12]